MKYLSTLLHKEAFYEKEIFVNFDRLHQAAKKQRQSVKLPQLT